MANRRSMIQNDIWASSYHHSCRSNRLYRYVDSFFTWSLLGIHRVLAFFGKNQKICWYCFDHLWWLRRQCHWFFSSRMITNILYPKWIIKIILNRFEMEFQKYIYKEWWVIIHNKVFIRTEVYYVLALFL